MQWELPIPLRDGTCLSATLYLPEPLPRPAPAIFILTPYVAQSYHDRGVYFAAHGYPFVAVDVRGRGNSGGMFECYATEAQDGRDVVEWLARQSYCNGKVAMWGGSYGGFVQWAVASVGPPHLATIVPVAAPFRGVDSPMRNNIFTPYRLQWLMMIAGRALQDRIFADQPFWNLQFKRWFESGVPFRSIDAFLGYRSPQLQEWLSHPHQDEYWDRHNPTAVHYAAISIPVLTITGAYDGDQPGALTHYREHLKHNPAACHYLVIGPWDHAGTRTPKSEFCGVQVGPASLVDLQRLHLEWYAWTMGEAATPGFLRKKVAYYVMGAEEWRYADRLEDITGRREPLYLQSSCNANDVFASGSLRANPPPRSDPDWFVYDPRDVARAELECSIDPESKTDQRMLYASSGKLLVYHSLPYARGAEIIGFFELSAWLSIDQPDTDLQATIYEVAVDGSAIQLTNDLMRARYRESFRTEQLISTKEPLPYEFKRFMFVARRLAAGSRLRLVIGPINSIYSQKNYNSGGAVSDESMKDARTVTVRLFHDESHLSALRVPLGRTGAHGGG